VSDSWAGPGWWQASDGKWYPPESAPAKPDLPPPPASSGHPFGAAPTSRPKQADPYSKASESAESLSPTFSGWLQGIFWAAGAVGVVAAGLALTAYNTLDDLVRPSRGYEDFVEWADAHDALERATGLFSLSSIALFVLLVIWTHRCYKVADTLQPGERRWSSGWSVGAWFIPLAGVLLPKLVIDETERIATTERRGGVVAPTWRSKGVDQLGWWWWGCFMASYACLAIGSVVGSDVTTATESDLRTHYVLLSVGFGAAAGAGACGALYTRKVSRRLSPGAMRAGWLTS
jgi:hypothetical protein